MSPPVFLSEEEALLVIREELGKSKVQASQTNFVAPGVTITPGLGEFTRKGDKWEYIPAFGKPLRASAADPKQKVAVTFVSDRNYHQLGAPGSGSTVQSYDMKALATNVAAKVQQQGKEKLYFGTFYDPLTKRFGLGSAVAAAGSNGEVTSSNKVVATEGKYLGQGKSTLMFSQSTDMVDARAESKRLLRLQVQDFLKWLQAQGAI